MSIQRRVRVPSHPAAGRGGEPRNERLPERAARGSAPANNTLPANRSAGKHPLTHSLAPSFPALPTLPPRGEPSGDVQVLDYIVPVVGGYVLVWNENDAALRAAEPDALGWFVERLEDLTRGWTHHLAAREPAHDLGVAA